MCVKNYKIDCWITLFIDLGTSQKSGEIQAPHIMIKAPFRFDVEYFSIIVLLKQEDQEERHQFRNEKERDSYLSKAKNMELVSRKQLKIMEDRNYYTITVPKHILYVFIQNKQNFQLLASASTSQEIENEAKTVFPEISSIYTYIKSNYNSQMIKMTNKGSILIDFYTNEKIYKLRMDSFSVISPSNDIEEIWDQFKMNWDNRKESKFDSSENYLRFVHKGRISVLKYYKRPPSRGSQESKQLEEQQNEGYLQQIPRFRSRHGNQLELIKTPESKRLKQSKLQQKWRKKRRRQNSEFLSSQESSISQRSRLVKTKKYQNYQDQDDSSRFERQTPKNMVRHRNMYEDKTRLLSMQQSNRLGEFRERHKLLNGDQYAFASKYIKIDEKGPKNLQPVSRIQQSLKRIQYQINQLKKQNCKAEIIEGINQYFTYKFDKFIEVIMEQISKDNNSKQKINDFHENTSLPLKFKDQLTEKAFDLFFSEKSHIFIQEFRLPLQVAKQNIERLWIQMGKDGQKAYVEKLQSPMMQQKKNTNESSKSGQFNIIKLSEKEENDLNSHNLQQQIKNESKPQNIKNLDLPIGSKNELNNANQMPLGDSEEVQGLNGSQFNQSDDYKS